MQANPKEYRQKLMSYSKSTIQKITDLVTSREMLITVYEIVMESKTEQEVIEQLNSLTKTAKVEI